MPNVSNIRITDPYILTLIEEEQRAAGEPNPSRTTHRMLIERATLARAERAMNGGKKAAKTDAVAEPSVA